MDKKLPTFSEGETAILGACMIDNSCLSSVCEIVRPEHFYSTRNAAVFQAIQDLFHKNQPVDNISIPNALRTMGKLEQCGGYEFINELLEVTPSAANVGHYAEIVVKKSRLRAAIGKMSELTSRCYEPDADPCELEEEFQSAAFRLFKEQERSSGLITIHEVISSSLATMDKGQDSGIPSGLTDLDRLVGGFVPGNLVIIGGRPGMGKTALGLGMLEAAARHGFCGLFSMEMTPRQITGRLIARKSGLNVQKLRKGCLEPWEWDRAFDAGDKIQNWPLMVDFSSRVSCSQIRSRIRQASIQNKKPMIMAVIDYLTLMKPEGFAANASEHTKVGSLTKGLKQIAKDFDMVIIALAQLNRQVDARQFKNKQGVHERKPRLSDFRESGSIEEDADIACGLYRAASCPEGKDDPQFAGKGEIIVLKNRDGMTGEVALAWTGETASYWDLSTDRVLDDRTATRYDRDTMQGL